LEEFYRLFPTYWDCPEILGNKYCRKVLGYRTLV